jgi:hypothetical protein
VKRLTLLFAALSFGVLACSSPPSQPPDSSSFPEQPYMQATSTSGSLHVELRTSPQPPAVGNDDVQLLVTDSSGAPRDGLTVSVKPWMPAHDHGTSQTTVMPQGGGKYLVTNVYLYMSGVWQLQIGFAGPVSDDASIQFELP